MQSAMQNAEIGKEGESVRGCRFGRDIGLGRAEDYRVRAFYL